MGSGTVGDEVRCVLSTDGAVSEDSDLDELMPFELFARRTNHAVSHAAVTDVQYGFEMMPEGAKSTPLSAVNRQRILREWSGLQVRG